jgi:peptidoglycan/LPS O-acetylase OafA/YrhL
MEIIEAKYLNNLSGSGFGIKPSSFLFSTFAILFFFNKNIEKKYKQNKFNTFIANIGRISFCVYLTHCYVIRLISYLDFETTWLIKWFVVALVDITLVFVAQKILPTKAHKYIGII